MGYMEQADLAYAGKFPIGKISPGQVIPYPTSNL
jgi:hypothetical protein